MSLQQAEMEGLCFKARSGDREAMKQLLVQYRPLMVHLAQRWPVYGFEDALQEAHVAALEAVHQFDPNVGCYFGSFLKQRIRAHLRTWGRRQVRWSERNMVASAESSREDSFPIEEWADVQPHVGRLNIEWKECLNVLSPRERLVIEKHVIEGYSVQEIADQESVSRYTVHTWKKRAMKKLRDRVVPF